MIFACHVHDRRWKLRIIEGEMHMSTTVKLTVVRGWLEGNEFVFRYPTVCTLGRGPGCLLQLPNNWAFQEISRRHCVINIDPPQVHVRDLGSRNGTFVNGQNIGQRLTDGEGQDQPNAPLEYSVDDGDEIRVGNLVFRVGITESCFEDADPSHFDCAKEDAVAHREWCDVCPCV